MSQERQSYLPGVVTRIDRGMPEGIDAPKCLQEPKIYVTFDDERLGTVGLPIHAAAEAIAVGDRVYVTQCKEGRARKLAIRRIPPMWEHPAA